MQVATTIDGDNGMVVKRLSVPIGLEELMESLTKQILLKKPDDVYAFASEHFTHLLAIRDQKLSENPNENGPVSRTKPATNTNGNIKIRSATIATKFQKLPTPIIFTNSKTAYRTPPRTPQTRKSAKTSVDASPRSLERNTSTKSSSSDASHKPDFLKQGRVGRARWKKQDPAKKGEKHPIALPTGRKQESPKKKVSSGGPVKKPLDDSKAKVRRTPSKEDPKTKDKKEPIIRSISRDKTTPRGKNGLSKSSSVEDDISVKGSSVNMNNKGRLRRSSRSIEKVAAAAAVAIPVGAVAAMTARKGKKLPADVELINGINLGKTGMVISCPEKPSDDSSCDTDSKVLVKDETADSDFVDEEDKESIISEQSEQRVEENIETLKEENIDEEVSKDDTPKVDTKDDNDTATPETAEGLRDDKSEIADIEDNSRKEEIPENAKSITEPTDDKADVASKDDDIQAEEHSQSANEESLAALKDTQKIDAKEDNDTTATAEELKDDKSEIAVIEDNLQKEEIPENAKSIIEPTDDKTDVASKDDAILAEEHSQSANEESLAALKDNDQNIAASEIEQHDSSVKNDTHEKNTVSSEDKPENLTNDDVTKEDSKSAKIDADEENDAESKEIEPKEDELKCASAEEEKGGLEGNENGEDKSHATEESANVKITPGDSADNNDINEENLASNIEAADEKDTTATNEEASKTSEDKIAAGGLAEGNDQSNAVGESHEEPEESKGLEDTNEVSAVDAQILIKDGGKQQEDNIKSANDNDLTSKVLEDLKEEIEVVNDMKLDSGEETKSEGISKSSDALKQLENMSDPEKIADQDELKEEHGSQPKMENEVTNTPNDNKEIETDEEQNSGEAGTIKAEDIVDDSNEKLDKSEESIVQEIGKVEAKENKIDRDTPGHEGEVNNTAVEVEQIDKVDTTKAEEETDDDATTGKDKEVITKAGQEGADDENENASKSEQEIKNQATENKIDGEKLEEGPPENVDEITKDALIIMEDEETEQNKNEDIKNVLPSTIDKSKDVQDSEGVKEELSKEKEESKPNETDTESSKNADEIKSVDKEESQQTDKDIKEELIENKTIASNVEITKGDNEPQAGKEDPHEGEAHNNEEIKDGNESADVSKRDISRNQEQMKQESESMDNEENLSDENKKNSEATLSDQIKEIKEESDVSNEKEEIPKGENAQNETADDTMTAAEEHDATTQDILSSEKVEGLENQNEVKATDKEHTSSSSEQIKEENDNKENGTASNEDNEGDTSPNINSDNAQPKENEDTSSKASNVAKAAVIGAIAAPIIKSIADSNSNEDAVVKNDLLSQTSDFLSIEKEKYQDHRDTKIFIQSASPIATSPAPNEDIKDPPSLTKTATLLGELKDVQTPAPSPVKSDVEDDGPLKLEDLSEYLKKDDKKTESSASTVEDNTEDQVDSIVTEASVHSGDVFGQTVKPVVPHVEELSKNTQHMAATKIQSMWRGHSSRKTLQPIIPSPLPEQTTPGWSPDEVSKAATVIQAFIRGHLVRKQFKPPVPSSAIEARHLDTLVEDKDEENPDEDISEALKKLDSIVVPDHDPEAATRRKRSLGEDEEQEESKKSIFGSISEKFSDLKKKITGDDKDPEELEMEPVLITGTEHPVNAIEETNLDKINEATGHDLNKPIEGTGDKMHEAIEAKVNEAIEEKGEQIHETLEEKVGKLDEEIEEKDKSIMENLSEKISNVKNKIAGKGENEEQLGDTPKDTKESLSESKEEQLGDIPKDTPDLNEEVSSLKNRITAKSEHEEQLGDIPKDTKETSSENKEEQLGDIPKDTPDPSLVEILSEKMSSLKHRITGKSEHEEQLGDIPKDTKESFSENEEEQLGDIPKDTPDPSLVEILSEKMSSLKHRITGKSDHEEQLGDIPKDTTESLSEPKEEQLGDIPHDTPDTSLIEALGEKMSSLKKRLIGKDSDNDKHIESPEEEKDSAQDSQEEKAIEEEKLHGGDDKSSITDKISRKMSGIKKFFKGDKADESTEAPENREGASTAAFLDEARQSSALDPKHRKDILTEETNKSPDDILQSNINQIGEDVSQKVDAAVNLTNDSVAGIDDTLHKIEDNADHGEKMIEESVNKVGDAIEGTSDAIEDTTKIAQEKADAATTSITEGVETLTHRSADIAKSTSDDISNGIDNMKDIVQSSTDEIKESTKNLGEDVKSSIGEIQESTKDPGEDVKVQESSHNLSEDGKRLANDPNSSTERDNVKSSIDELKDSEIIKSPIEECKDSSEKVIDEIKQEATNTVNKNSVAELKKSANASVDDIIEDASKPFQEDHVGIKTEEVPLKMEDDNNDPAEEQHSRKKRSLNDEESGEISQENTNTEGGSDVIEENKETADEDKKSVIDSISEKITGVKNKILGTNEDNESKTSSKSTAEGPNKDDQHADIENDETKKKSLLDSISDKITDAKNKILGNEADDGDVNQIEENLVSNLKEAKPGSAEGVKMVDPHTNTEETKSNDEKVTETDSGKVLEEHVKSEDSEETKSAKTGEPEDDSKEVEVEKSILGAISGKLSDVKDAIFGGSGDKHVDGSDSTSTNDALPNKADLVGNEPIDGVKTTHDENTITDESKEEKGSDIDKEKVIEEHVKSEDGEATKSTKTGENEPEDNKEDKAEKSILGAISGKLSDVKGAIFGGPEDKLQDSTSTNDSLPNTDLVGNEPIDEVKATHDRPNNKNYTIIIDANIKKEDPKEIESKKINTELEKPFEERAYEGFIEERGDRLSYDARLASPNLKAKSEEHPNGEGSKGLNVSDKSKSEENLVKDFVSKNDELLNQTKGNENNQAANDSRLDDTKLEEVDSEIEENSGDSGAISKQQDKLLEAIPDKITDDTNQDGSVAPISKEHVTAADKPNDVIEAENIGGNGSVIAEQKLKDIQDKPDDSSEKTYTIPKESADKSLDKTYSVEGNETFNIPTKAVANEDDTEKDLSDESLNLTYNIDESKDSIGKTEALEKVTLPSYNSEPEMQESHPETKDSMKVGDNLGVDESVTKDTLNRQNEAATKIQTVFREYRNRNVNNKNGDTKNTFKSAMTEVAAATIIQSLFRGHSIRNKKSKNNIKATPAPLTNEKDKPSENEDINTTEDQNKNRLDENDAATKIQSAFRGYSIRSKRSAGEDTSKEYLQIEETKKHQGEETLASEDNNNKNDQLSLNQPEATEAANNPDLKNELNDATVETDKNNINESKVASLKNEESTPSENDAATKIQSVFRGYQSRHKRHISSVGFNEDKLVAGMDSNNDKALEITPIKDDEASKSEGKIDTSKKVPLKENDVLKKTPLSEDAAAAKIQSLFRGFIVRHKNKIIASSPSTEHKKDGKEEAAVKIQTLFREFIARNKTRNNEPDNNKFELGEETKKEDTLKMSEKDAAVKIQSLFRGYVIRHKNEIMKNRKKKDNEESQKESDAAMKITQLFSGCMEMHLSKLKEDDSKQEEIQQQDPTIAHSSLQIKENITKEEQPQMADTKTDSGSIMEENLKIDTEPDLSSNIEDAKEETQLKIDTKTDLSSNIEDTREETQLKIHTKPDLTSNAEDTKEENQIKASTVEDEKEEPHLKVDTKPDLSSKSEETQIKASTIEDVKEEPHLKVDTKPDLSSNVEETQIKASTIEDMDENTQQKKIEGNTNEENRAATKIQSMFRGFLVRNKKALTKIAATNEDKTIGNKVLNENDAALKIQHVFREYISKNKGKRLALEESIKDIKEETQLHHILKSETGSKTEDVPNDESRLKQVKKAKIEDPIKDETKHIIEDATKTEAQNVRKSASSSEIADAPKEEMSENAAATKIQSIFRGFVVRNKKAIIEEDKIKERDAALRIQRVFREYINKNKSKQVQLEETPKAGIIISDEALEKRNLEAHPIPENNQVVNKANIEDPIKEETQHKNESKSVSSSKLEDMPKEEMSEHAAATKIQSVFRGFVVRNKKAIIEEDKIKERDAALRIQRVFREYINKNRPKQLQLEETPKADIDEALQNLNVKAHLIPAKNQDTSKNEGENLTIPEDVQNSSKEETNGSEIPAKKEDAQRINEDVAATKIQSVFRGYSVRNQNILSSSAETANANKDMKKVISSNMETPTGHVILPKTESLPMASPSAVGNADDATSSDSEEANRIPVSEETADTESKPIEDSAKTETHTSTGAEAKDANGSNKEEHNNALINEDVTDTNIEKNPTTIEDKIADDGKSKQKSSLEEAAVKIQSMFRGYKVRNQNKQVKNEDKPVLSVHDAAVKIQSMFRGYKARNLNVTTPITKNPENKKNFEDSAISDVEDSEADTHEILDQIKNDLNNMRSLMESKAIDSEDEDTMNDKTIQNEDNDDSLGDLHSMDDDNKVDEVSIEESKSKNSEDQKHKEISSEIKKEDSKEHDTKLGDNTNNKLVNEDQARNADFDSDIKNQSKDKNNDSKVKTQDKPEGDSNKKTDSSTELYKDTSQREPKNDPNITLHEDQSKKQDINPDKTEDKSGNKVIAIQDPQDDHSSVSRLTSLEEEAHRHDLRDTLDTPLSLDRLTSVGSTTSLDSAVTVVLTDGLDKLSKHSSDDPSLKSEENVKTIEDSIVSKKEDSSTNKKKHKDENNQKTLLELKNEENAPKISDQDVNIPKSDDVKNDKLRMSVQSVDEPEIMPRKVSHCYDEDKHQEQNFEAILNAVTAATKIQSFYRGYRIRNKKIEEHQPNNVSEKEENIAALKIQALFREILARKRTKEENTAALKIQKLFRVLLEKNHFRVDQQNVTDEKNQLSYRSRSAEISHDIIEYPIESRSNSIDAPTSEGADNNKENNISQKDVARTKTCNSKNNIQAKSSDQPKTEAPIKETSKPESRSNSASYKSTETEAKLKDQKDSSRPKLGDFIRSLAESPKLCTDMDKLKAKSEEIENTVKSSILELENMSKEIDNQAKSEPFYLHDPNSKNENPIAAAIRVSSRATNREPSIGLLHSGEFHDAVPLNFTPSNINVVVHDQRVASRHGSAPSSPVLMHSGELHDSLFPHVSDAAAGAAPVTSAPGGGGDVAQASLNQEADGGAVSFVRPVLEMDAKRNNATILEKNEEAQAATKIQASFRGYQVRKQMKGKNGSDITTPIRRAPRRKSSGKMIDSCKCQKKKDSGELEERSATKIQAGIRGFLVRRRQNKKSN